MAQLVCSVVTPEETALETKAEFVAVSLYDGEIGIAPLHSPMIGRLGCGELRITSNNETQKYYIDGGFIQVADDMVAVLTNSVTAASAIDIEAARTQLEEAQGMAPASPEEFAARDKQLEEARAKLAVAGA